MTMMLDKLLFDAMIRTQPDIVRAVVDAKKNGKELVISSEMHNFSRDHLTALGAIAKFGGLNGVVVRIMPLEDEHTIVFDQRMTERRSIPRPKHHHKRRAAKRRL